MDENTYTPTTGYTASDGTDENAYKRTNSNMAEPDSNGQQLFKKSDVPKLPSADIDESANATGTHESSPSPAP